MKLETNIDSGNVRIERSKDGTETTVKEEPDLTTRVSQFKPEESKELKTEPTGEKEVKEEKEKEIKEPEFDFKEIENIKDPEAKAWAEKAYKSFQKGFNNKFQEIAELRKSLESQKNQPQAVTWTPERLQQEINKPDFVSAAQAVMKNQNPEGSGLTDEEYSALSEKEKQKFQIMEQKLLQLERQNSLIAKREEDERLKGKYANYNPEAMDILTADLISGKVQANREHLFKAYDYDSAIRRAYELGKIDKQLTNEEKVSSMSPEGTTAQATEGALEKEKGESDRAWFVRNALNRLVKSREGQIRK